MNCPPLLLSLPRDQRVRMPVNVHARSFPATIRETSSRRNRHLRHRNSHNGDDHRCKIKYAFRPLSLRHQEPLRSGCTSISLPFPQLPSRSRSLTNSPQSASEALIKGYPREPPVNSPVQNVNQLTIDLIGYILSQCQRPVGEAMRGRRQSR